MSHDDAHKPILDDNHHHGDTNQIQVGVPVMQASAEMPHYDEHCKCCIKRCQDDHNSCLAHVNLSEGYAFFLFLISFVFLGGLSRYCYMCCSAHEKAPRWIWKNFFWLNIWISMSYCILVGYFWDICFTY